MAMEFDTLENAKKALLLLRSSQISIQIGEEHRELFAKPDRPPQIRKEGRLFSFLYQEVKTLIQKTGAWQSNFRLGVSKGMLFISVGEETLLELFTIRKNGDDILGLESGRHISRVNISPEKASSLAEAAWSSYTKELRQ